MKKPSIFCRVLFLIMFCVVLRFPNSFSKSISFSEHNIDLKSQQQIYKKPPSPSEEELIKIWRNFLKKYPLAKDAT